MSRTFDDVARIASSPIGFIAAIGVGGFALWFMFFRDKSPLNPENTATDSQGNPVTAYKSVGGPLGWLGAATNNVLGGYPATIGQYIGDNLPIVGSPGCAPICNPMGDLSAGATSCSDPIHGPIFADSFQYPAGKRIPTSAQTRERSGSIQSWSARPHQAGNNAAYADAWDSSPPDPSYTLNVLVRDPKASYAGA